jgi:hypothetical protein
MLISRRAALKTAVATAVGSVVGGATYGMAFERHRIGMTEADLSVVGLPDALDGLRIGFITDIHHSRLVPASDILHALDLTSAPTSSSWVATT